MTLLPFAALGLALVFAFVWKTSIRTPSGFPNGPKGLPVVGNLFDMPSRREWLTFTEWKKSYGDFIGMTILGQRIVILNSYEAVMEMLEKRGTLYSDRPNLTLFRKWIGWDWSLPILPFGDELQRQRKLLSQCLSPAASKTYNVALHEQALLYCKQLLKFPDRFQKHSRTMTGAIVMMIVYGHRVKEENDEWISLAERFSDLLGTLGVPGSHPVDIFPSLWRLPPIIFGSGFAARMNLMRTILQQLFREPYQQVKQKMADGSIHPCIAQNLIETHTASTGEITEEKSIMACTAVSYTAAVDTTVASLDTFILAMMIHPDIQKKAQQHIDDLLNGSRLPMFADRVNLPYVDAILKELYRWQPVTPLALPHRNMKDDRYGDYFFPKGTMFIPNAWLFLHDEEYFPEPSKFIPERFIDEDGKLATVPRDPITISFGFGRRVCPGKYLADNSMWITMASVLALFDITKPKDAFGNDIEPDLEYESGAAVSRPKPFKCCITPRSDASAALLMASLEQL
ncbi:cytochrome P450 [Sistotremastrum suecicum HHB10207 ss-3]|uniref:Cytochrome P450 n=1 Tax=Sistotremastrum suecicum HHB10207 ss-3 TaxID=1314776 RepID=A0A166GJA1_9AGAM|nr:cytochrome P450 [Sistotremastrum suecicum HHB10207 ss-3]